MSCSFFRCYFQQAHLNHAFLYNRSTDSDKRFNWKDIAALQSKIGQVQKTPTKFCDYLLSSKLSFNKANRLWFNLCTILFNTRSNFFKELERRVDLLIKEICSLIKVYISAIYFISNWSWLHKLLVTTQADHSVFRWNTEIKHTFYYKSAKIVIKAHFLIVESRKRHLLLHYYLQWLYVRLRAN